MGEDKADDADQVPGNAPWVMLDDGLLKERQEMRVAARMPHRTEGDAPLVVRYVRRPPPGPEGRPKYDVQAQTVELKKSVDSLALALSRCLRDEAVCHALWIAYGDRIPRRPHGGPDHDDEQASYFLSNLLRWNYGAEKGRNAQQPTAPAKSDTALKPPSAIKQPAARPQAGWFWAASTSAAPNKGKPVSEADYRDVPPRPEDTTPLIALGAWDINCWIGPDGLGPVARLLLLVEFLLEEYSGDLGEEIQNSGFTPAEALTELRKALNRGGTSAPSTTETHYLVPWPVHRALAEALNRLPCRRHLLPVTYTDLVQQPFGPVLGIESVHAYKHWLRHGVTPFMSLPDKDDAHSSADDAAKWLYDQGSALLDGLKAQVHDVGHGRPIVGLHSVTRPSWIRRIAKEVVEHGPHGQGIERRVVWLRAADPTDSNHMATLRAFLKPLCQAFGVTLWPETATPENSHVAMVLEALRGALWGTPCIVVIDGVFNAGDTRVAPLLDFLSDTSALTDLIRGLATPPVDEAFAPDKRLELEHARHVPYCQTRFLVLSSQPCGALEPLTSKSFELTGPLPGQSDVSKALTEVHARLEHHDIWRYDAAAVYEGPLASISSPWAADSKTPYVAERNEIWSLLTRLRAQHSPYLLVVGFIAGSADGMLHASLHRTFGIWRGLAGVDKKGTPSGVLGFCNRADKLIRGLAAGSGARDIERVIPRTWAPDDFTDSDDIDEAGDVALRRFMTCMGPLLSVDIEQVVEDGLGERQLKWEVGPMPGGRAAPPEIGDTPSQRKGSFRRGIAIWNPLVRDVIAQFFLSHDGGAVTSMDGLLGRKGWQLIHAASASEVLRQGTALLRSAHAQDLSSLSRYRRVVQSLYHLVIAGELDGIELPGVDHDTFDHQSLFLPKEPGARAVWAFVILYRSILERHSSWRLTRHWARSELRTALLTQLMFPSHQPQFVATPIAETVLEESLASDTSQRNDPNAAWARLETNWHGALEMAARAKVRRGQQEQENQRQTRLGSLGMWNIYLTNISNAAVDSEDPRMLRFAKLELESLRRALAQAAIGAPATVAGIKAARAQHPVGPLDYATDNLNFEKTIADINDQRGQPGSTLQEVQAAMAAKKIPFNLEKHLKHAAFEVATLVLGPIKAYDGLPSEVQQAPTLLTKAARVLRNTVTTPLNSSLPASFLDGIDSLLSRHGSFLADEASKVPVEHFEKRLHALTLAFVTFFVSDAVRDMVGRAAEAQGKSFGYVSSRYWRVSIRTTLSLARLISRHKAEGKLGNNYWFEPHEVDETVDWLLDHARAKCDILVRDTHVFDRERMFAILAQVAVVRTMAGVGKDRGEDQRVIRSRLADAVGYLASAERRYIQLGSPLALARRYYVERIATLCAWVRFASTDDPVDDKLILRVACMAVNDLDTLDGHSAGNDFWEWLWVQRYRKFRSMHADLRLPIEIPERLVARHTKLSQRYTPRAGG